MEQTVKISDYMIAWLESLGIKHVFTIPGGGCSHLIDSLGKSKSIEYVIPLHEQGGAIMAEAYAQYTGKPAAVIVTTGPGATNVLTPIVAAWQESTPLIVIAGQVNTKDDYEGYFKPRQTGFQHVRNESIMSSVCVFSGKIKKPEDLYGIVTNANAHVTDLNTRRGPVFIEIPLDIQSAETSEPLPTNKNSEVYYKLPIIWKLENLLAKSKKPIILLGNGVRLGGAEQEFNEFIERFKIPVLTTWKAMDLMTEDHPLYVGRPGIIANRGANINQQNADLVICLGARLDHGQTAYDMKNFAPKAKKFVIDIDPHEIYKHDDFVIFYSLPLKDFFALSKGRSYQCNQKWLDHCKKVYNKYSDLAPKFVNLKDPINLYALVDCLSLSMAALGDKAVLVPGSSGACSEVVHQALKISKGMRVINTHGLGSMGFGISAAIGVALASKKRVVAIEGDGGFFMNMQELEVAARYKLPIAFIVLNNDGYGSIRTTQNAHFNGNIVGCDSNTGLTLPSLEKTAALFNMSYKKISCYFDEVAYEGLVTEFCRSIENCYYPMIIEVVVERDHKSLPKVAVTKNAEGKFEAASMEYMNPPISEEEMQENRFE